MPDDWAQRLRQLGKKAGNPDLVDPFRPPAGAANPFSSPGPAPGYPAAGAYDPFANAAQTASGYGPNGGGWSSGVSPFTGGPQGVLPVPEPSGSASVQPRPLTVKVATWTLVAAATLTLVLGGMGAYAILELRTTFGRVLALDQTGTANLLASGYADDTQVVLMVISTAVAAVMAVVYLFVARAIWRGRSWPRVLSPFLVVLSIPAVFIGPVAIVIVFAGAISAAAAWLPSARAYAQQYPAFRAFGRTRR